MPVREVVIRAKRILRGLWFCLRKVGVFIAGSTTVTYADGSVACFDLIGRHYLPTPPALPCSATDAEVIRRLEDLWNDGEPEAHLIVCVTTAPEALGLDPSTLDLPSLRECPSLRSVLEAPACKVRVTTAEAAGRRHRDKRCFHFPVSVTRREWEQVATRLESGQTS